MKELFSPTGTEARAWTDAEKDELFNAMNTLSLIEAKAICEANGFAVVPVEDCPNCFNNGVIQHSSGDIEQCQFCYQMPQSRFNQNEAMLEASKDKP